MSLPVARALFLRLRLLPASAVEGAPENCPQVRVFSVSLCFAALARGDYLVSSTAAWCTNCRSAKARPSRLMRAAS